jgi:hypothetical protein
MEKAHRRSAGNGLDAAPQPSFGNTTGKTHGGETNGLERY